MNDEKLKRLEKIENRNKLAIDTVTARESESSLAHSICASDIPWLLSELREAWRQDEYKTKIILAATKDFERLREELADYREALYRARNAMQASDVQCKYITQAYVAVKTAIAKWGMR